AILVLALPQEAAGQVMRGMGTAEVEDLAREVAIMGSVPQEVRAAVVEEFYQMAMAQSWATEGGLDYARTLLEKSLDPQHAQQVVEQIAQEVQRAPFAFLQKAEADSLLTFIRDEHPQTISLILSHLPAQKAGEIVAGLAPDRQVEVVRRMANMEQTNPKVIREVEEGLHARLASALMQRFEQTGGLEAVAEVLNLVDRDTEKGILEGLEAEDPELVEGIRRLMFIFEDLLLIDDKGIQTVLKEVDNDELALALKTASDELKGKIMGNMSERAAQVIEEDMEFMGPVRVSDVEAAQMRIVDIVRRLEDAGELIVAGRGGDSEVIV
ncbi:MAG: flagellar motor switch protein FliG, partial [Phycisphaerae bacterium]|nr:flagellar motor switch protein FliG [Phycisphaerae bacterium]